MNLSIDIFSRVTSKEKTLIARQLATMLDAGFGVDQAFKVLYSQTKNHALLKAYIEIVRDIEQGSNLSMALSRQGKIFDPVFIAIVRSGENSGKLAQVLAQLADRMEMTEDFNNKIRGAMYYPGFVLATMIVILILMMIFIIPKLKGVFTDLGVQLPVSTRAIIWFSDFTVKFWWLELIVVLILTALGYFFLKSKNGGSYWDNIKIKIPLLNELFILIYMTRFCQTMSMLISSGIPIMETIAISSDVIQNKAYADSLKIVSTQVERGIPMSVPLSRDPHFPVMVSQLIAVGEQTGRMSQVLSKLSEYYEKETNARIKNISGLIEPILIVLVGIGVAFLVFSIIWPPHSTAQTGF